MDAIGERDTKTQQFNAPRTSAAGAAAQPSAAPTPDERAAVLALARRGVRPVAELLLGLLPELPPPRRARLMGDIDRLNRHPPELFRAVGADAFARFRPRPVPDDLGGDDPDGGSTTW